MLKPVILLSPEGGGGEGGKEFGRSHGYGFQGGNGGGISRRQQSIRERQGEIIRI